MLDLAFVDSGNLAEASEHQSFCNLRGIQGSLFEISFLVATTSTTAKDRGNCYNQKTVGSVGSFELSRTKIPRVKRKCNSSILREICFNLVLKNGICHKPVVFSNSKQQSS